MATATQSPNDQSVVQVVSEIVDDFQSLIKQQIDLVRAEVRSDWDKSKQALWPIAVGSGLLLVSGLLLSVMLVFLLHWATLPPDSVAVGLPLWACFGIVGLLFLASGGGLVFAGIKRFQSFNPLPDQSIQALKEMMP